ncbi:hypothetical protein RJ641_029223 [Dillenia turbinata]|uniref:Uncharacterized protein n=1 Tax=Dillenia turbinata TaxID=194707 RepID=A0AAN8ZJ82_9MAGN
MEGLFSCISVTTALDLKSKNNKCCEIAQPLVAQSLSQQNMSQRRVFTHSEVSQHKSKTDCWLIINGWVLNVKVLGRTPRRRRGVDRGSWKGCNGGL